MAELYEDLLIDSSESFEDGDYFLVTITELELGTTYPIEFRWKYKDGTFGKDWSAVYNLSTPIATVPNEPKLLTTDVEGGAGFIKVTWSGNDASGNPLENIDRIDIHISGTSFGDGTKPAGSFKIAGTQTFTAEPGVYIVQLKTITVNGGSSFFSDARTVTVTSLGEVIQEPTTPNGFTSKRILAGIEVSWAGTYSDSTFTGFEAIKIYAGTSASATSGTYTEVGVLTGNNVKNTIVVPVDGTYVAYGQAVYIHAAAVNKNGTVGTIQANVTSQALGPGKATDADINDGAIVISKLAADVLTVGNLKAGDINSTSYIRAGTSGSARVEISSSTVGSVLPGLTVYDSSGTQILRAPLTGGLTINGGGTFSGNLSAAGGTFTGTLSAATGSFSGTITASGGTIGGITIAAAALQNNSVESSSTFKLDSAGKARFGAFSGNAIIINPAANIGSAYLFHSANGGSSASDKFSFLQSGGFRLGGSNGINYDGSSSLTIGSSGNPITINTSTGAVSISGVITAGNLTDGTTTISGNNITTGTITGRTVTVSGSTVTTTISGSTGIISIDDTSSGGLYGGGINISSSSRSSTLGGTGLSWSQGSYTGAVYMDSSGTVNLKASATQSITITADDNLHRSAYPIYMNGHVSILNSISANGSATFGSVGSQFEFLSTSGNVRVAQTYNNVVSLSPRTMSVNSNGLYGYVSSTIRHKKNINDYIVDEESLMSLNVKSFSYKNDETNSLHYGFIAEDAVDLGLEELVQMDKDGLPEYFDYARLSVFLFQVVKTQKNKIIDLERRLDALEG